MPETGICPTCSAKTLDGVCRACAFTAALAGLAADDGNFVAASAGMRAPRGYQLLHQLGAGAMGVVWLARERSLDRLAALKIIGTGAGRRLAQRLIREGQSVARLRHPHIVSVHALGEDENGAWLAMDFLPGGDLRGRLARGLPNARLAGEWVHKLSEALAHAHAGGVLHRDIKPSNVLLSEDEEPQLADFGLAVPLDGGGDLTMPGQIAGTAAYLAPELLAGADRASVASDVYGLGALLYECLTGRAPFIGDSATAIFSQLQNTDPPAPHLLRADVPRDLETICLKCLEKIPARRYVSAVALRDDLGRFLRDEPIEARPVGRAGRAVRWCRRHPATAALAGATAVLLLGLSIGGPLVALRLARANARATAEAASSRAVSEFLGNDLLAQAAPDNEPDRDIKLRTILDRAAAALDGRFTMQPIVEADLRDTVAATYFALGEFEPARRHWERSRELREREHGPQDRKALAAAAHVFDALRCLGKLAEAEKLGVDVIARQRAALGPADPDTLLSLSHLAIVHRFQARYPEAEAVYQEALKQQRLATGPDSPEALTIMNNLAVVYRHQRKFVEADALQTETLQSRMRVVGPEHPDTLHSLSNLSLVKKDLGQLPEAERLAAEALSVRERILGYEHPHTLISMTSLAAIQQDQGKLVEAEVLCERALEIQRGRLGPDHPDTLNLMNNLGTVYRDRGKLDEAEQILSDTLARRLRILGNGHPATLSTTGNLARVYQSQGKLDEAIALLSEGRALAQEHMGDSHALTKRFGQLLDQLISARAAPSDATAAQSADGSRN
jgi:tetratricopeptide (TPR) repeat protein